MTVLEGKVAMLWAASAAAPSVGGAVRPGRVGPAWEAVAPMGQRRGMITLWRCWSLDGKLYAVTWWEINK